MTVATDDLQLFAEDMNLLENEAGPPIPASFVQALTEIGGLNRYGEPNLRVVWGQTATKWAWGKVRIKYPAVFLNEQITLGYDVLPKAATNKPTFYKRQEDIPAEFADCLVLPRMLLRREEIGLPRFIVESWVAPESLAKDEDEWNEGRWDYDVDSRELVDAAGPFPRQGRYEQFFTVQTPDKQFAPLGPEVLDLVKRTLRARDAVLKGLSFEEAVRNEVEEIKSKQRAAIAELGDRMQQAFNTPRIGGGASVTVPTEYGS